MADELKNVRISVMDHFNTQLGPTSSIDWDGVEFDSENVSEWLEPRLVGQVPSPTRSSERFETWLLNVNCYAKVGQDSAGSQLETIHRAWELADAVRAAFHQQTVLVKDWAASGDPTIGYLRFREIAANAVPGTGARPIATGQLMQVNVSVEGELIE